jgi:hypothetical protein
MLNLKLTSMHSPSGAPFHRFIQPQIKLKQHAFTVLPKVSFSLKLTSMHNPSGAPFPHTGCPGNTSVLLWGIQLGRRGLERKVRSLNVRRWRPMTGRCAYRTSGRNTWCRIINRKSKQRPLSISLYLMDLTSLSLFVKFYPDKRQNTWG